MSLYHDNSSNFLPQPEVANAFDPVSETGKQDGVAETAAVLGSWITATPGFVGFPLNKEEASLSLEMTSSAAVCAYRGLANTIKGWREEKRISKKISKPIVGTFAWLNLVFGESIAVGAQGVVQSGGASNWQSLFAGIGAAFAVETAFTLPIAAQNKEKQSSEKVVEAAATAFWLGGAMGAENKKLPIRQAWAPIGSYMLFGTGVAVVAEYNNLAEKALDHTNIIIPALLAWGVSKKVNEFFGYKTLSDKMADKSVDLVKVRRNRRRIAKSSN